MKIEHIALNVPDPNEMAAWYEAHLGMKTVKKLDEEPFTHFLADNSGDVMLEIYRNPPDAVPKYPNMNPLQLHLAFVSSTPAVDRDRLQLAGAAFVEEQQFEDGTHLVMMRDPWGVCIQLCKRGKGMLKSY